MNRLLAARHNHLGAQAYVRGGFGDEMDFACFAITSYFAALPGWQESRVDHHEVAYLSGFFAFVALMSSPSARLGPAEAATGARATVARRLMVRGTRAELLTERIRSFQTRLGEYSALWVGVLKSVNSFGAFSQHAFENVQGGDKTRQGYVEHLDNGFGSEVGHMTMDPEGELCNCGNRGCWEMQVSQRALFRYLRRAVGQGRASLLIEMTADNLGQLTVPIIVDAARGGDPLALEALDVLGHHLGIGIASLVNTLNPQLVVFGGILSLAGEFLLPVVEAGIRTACPALEP